MLRPTFSVLALALGIAASGPALAQKADTGKKKLYCWEEGGKKVCGDALPATAVDSARTEISARSGLATSKVGRALTAEERAEAERRAEEERQAQLTLAAERMRERAMAESYETEADLRRAFNERIALLDDTIKAAQLSIGGLRQSLVSLLRQAGEAELAGRPVPATLDTTIRSQHAELLRQQAMLGTHQRNRRDIDGELERALQTYRELKGPRTAEASGPVGGGDA